MLACFTCLHGLHRSLNNSPTKKKKKKNQGAIKLCFCLRCLQDQFVQWELPRALYKECVAAGGAISLLSVHGQPTVFQQLLALWDREESSLRCHLQRPNVRLFSAVKLHDKGSSRSHPSPLKTPSHSLPQKLLDWTPLLRVRRFARLSPATASAVAARVMFAKSQLELIPPWWKLSNNFLFLKNKMLILTYGPEWSPWREASLPSFHTPVSPEQADLAMFRQHSTNRCELCTRHVSRLLGKSSEQNRQTFLLHGLTF